MGNVYRDGDSANRHFNKTAWQAIYRRANSLADSFEDRHDLDDVQREYFWGLWIVSRGWGDSDVPDDFLDYAQPDVREAIKAGRARPGGHGLPGELTRLFPFEFPA